MMARGAWAALALGALAACAPAASAPVAGPRPRIVSLNPCADAILADVADPSQMLAISHYSKDPRSTSMGLAAARPYLATGGTVEEVLALRPDVVVAGTFLTPPARSAFERMGIRVVTYGIDHDVPGSIAQIRMLANMSGHQARGEALVQRIAVALARARPPAGARPISTVVWQSGGIVPGRDALVSDLMARTGFASHSAARGLGQADYLPLEEMLADPPELILAAGMPGEGESRMLAHPALAALNQTRRALLDPSLLYCGGPTIIRAVERLARVRAQMEQGA